MYKIELILAWSASTNIDTMEIVKPDIQLLEHNCSRWISKANSIAKCRVNMDVLRNSYSTSAVYSIKPELDWATQIVNSIDYKAISGLYLEMADFVYRFVTHEYSAWYPLRKQMKKDLQRISKRSVEIAWDIIFAGRSLQQIVHDLGMKMVALERVNREMLQAADEQAHKRTILCMVFAPPTLGLSCLAMIGGCNEQTMVAVRQGIQPALLENANTLIETGELFEQQGIAIAWSNDQEFGRQYYLVMQGKAERMRNCLLALNQKNSSERNSAESLAMIAKST